MIIKFFKWLFDTITYCEYCGKPDAYGDSGATYIKLCESCWKDIDNQNSKKFKESEY